jgi:hypothetical protein
MTSVQRKFAAGLISLFVIPSAHYIDQTTRLTPDDSAEPIYVFTQSPTPTPKPSIKTGNTATNADRQVPGSCKRAVSEEANRRGINNLRMVEKKGSDGKRFLKISGKVSASKSEFKEIVKALKNACTADEVKVESALVRQSH